MAQLTFKDFIYEVDHIVKGSDFIRGYRANGDFVVSFEGITDFSDFSYNCDCLTPDTCFSEKLNDVVYFKGSLYRRDGTVLTPAMYGVAASVDVKNSAPANLLDNSDFTNPVNQRGQDDYAVKGYTIDRWTTAGKNLALSFDDRGIVLTNSATAANGFTQYLNPDELLSNGEVVTLAVMVYNQDTDEYEIVCGSVTVSDTWSSGYKIAASCSGFGLRFYNDLDTYSSQMFTVMVSSGATVNLVWATLYKGEYTTETLPIYRPKGYSAELAECRRYFISLADSKLPVVITSTTTAECQIPMSPMRVIPTVSNRLSDMETNSIEVNGSTINGTGVTAGSALNGDVTLAITGSFSGKVHHVGMWETDIHLSADV